MQRRKFLATTAVALPGIMLGTTAMGNDAVATKGVVVKAGASRFNETTKLGGKSPNDIKVSSKDTNKQLAVFEYVGNEKGGPPLHLHLYQDEIFFIVAGNYTFKVGDDTYQLTAGDTIFLPRNVPHAFAQTSDKGRMFFMFQPAGKMEDFFRAIGALQAPPSPAEGAAIFEAHEMKVVGPPLVY